MNATSRKDSRNRGQRAISLRNVFSWPWPWIIIPVLRGLSLSGDTLPGTTTFATGCASISMSFLFSDQPKAANLREPVRRVEQSRPYRRTRPRRWFLTCYANDSVPDIAISILTIGHLKSLTFFSFDADLFQKPTRNPTLLKSRVNPKPSSAGR
jgi:hypothetical protein